MYSKLDFNAFKDGPARRRIGKYRLYGHSKFVGYPPYFKDYQVFIFAFREISSSQTNSLVDSATKVSFLLLSILET